MFIPYDCVCKIGVDVILVELYIDNNNKPNCKGKEKCKPQVLTYGSNQGYTINK